MDSSEIRLNLYRVGLSEGDSEDDTPPSPTGLHIEVEVSTDPESSGEGDPLDQTLVETGLGGPADALVGEIQSLPPSEPQLQPRMGEQAEFEEKYKTFQNNITLFRRKIKRTDVESLTNDDITPGTVGHANWTDLMQVVFDLKGKIEDDRDDILEDFSEAVASLDVKNQIEVEIQNTATAFNTFRAGYSAKCMALHSSAQPKDFKQVQAGKEAQYEQTKTMERIDKLRKVLKDVQIDTAASNESVLQHVDSIKDWKRALEKIEESMHNARKGGLLEDEEVSSLIAAVTEISDRTDLVIKTVKEDADRRNLSWNRSGGSGFKGEVTPFPKKFSGSKHGEDYWQFKQDMELALKQNKIPLDSQARKLRDFLDSPALAVVPRTENSIADCWKLLEACYGSSEAIFNSKLQQIRDLKPLTPLLNEVSEPVNPEERLKQLILLKSKIAEIQNMSSKDQNLKNKFCHESTINLIRERFDKEMKKDLITKKGL